MLAQDIDSQLVDRFQSVQQFKKGGGSAATGSLSAPESARLGSPIDGLGSATIASAYVSDHAFAPATSIASAAEYGYATADSATDDRTATGLDIERETGSESTDETVYFNRFRVNEVAGPASPPTPYAYTYATLFAVRLPTFVTDYQTIYQSIVFLPHPVH